MKKILTIIVLLSLVFSFSSCLNTEQATSASETHLQPSTNSQATISSPTSTEEPTGTTEAPIPPLSTAEPTANATESLSTSEPPPPIAPPSVTTMDFEGISELHSFIKNPLEKLKNAPQEMQNEYDEMCKKFVTNGIYSIESTTCPSLNLFVIFPCAEREDRGIGYYFWYKDQVIQAVVYETKGLSNQIEQGSMETYIEERFGFEMESTILENVNDLFLEAPLLQATERTSIWGMLDETHYLVLRSDCSKNVILEFMETLVVRKITLGGSSSEDSSESKTDAPTASTELAPDVPEDPPTGGPYLPFHWFGSIRDMDTFVTTLSTDPVDYQFRPLFGFAALESFVPEDFADYQPIENYFSLNKNDFQESKAGVGYMEGSPFVKYSYSFDNIGISIYQVNANHISECYARRESMNLSGEKITNYTSDSALKKGHLLRKGTDCDVIYYKEHGVIHEVNLLIGNTYIRVFSSVYFEDDVPYEEKLAKVQEEILTDPKYSCFAELFADDEETFNSAIAKIKVEK